MLSFIPNGGELANRIRCHRWEETPLGPLTSWPQSLRTLVSVMLEANQPMFIVWGPEQTLLYNDRYTSILGEKHPEALGQPFLKVWHEIEADLRPLVDDAYAGIPSHTDDIMLMMERNGYGLEELDGIDPHRDSALGGVGGSEGADTSLGTITGPGFNEDGIVDAVETATNVYLAQRTDGERFVDTFRRIGMAPFKEAIYG